MARFSVSATHHIRDSRIEVESARIESVQIPTDREVWLGHITTRRWRNIALLAIRNIASGTLSWSRLNGDGNIRRECARFQLPDNNCMPDTQFVSYLYRPYGSLWWGLFWIFGISLLAFPYRIREVGRFHRYLLRYALSYTQSVQFAAYVNWYRHATLPRGTPLVDT